MLRRSDRHSATPIGADSARSELTGAPMTLSASPIVFEDVLQFDCPSRLSQIHSVLTGLLTEDHAMACNMPAALEGRFLVYLFLFGGATDIA